VSNPSANTVRYCAQPCSVAGCAVTFNVQGMSGSCTCGANGACSDQGSLCYPAGDTYGPP
jgi:hypothetical protein